MSNGERDMRVEGLLLIPPGTAIKNPEIRTEGNLLKFREGTGRFTHKGVVIPALTNCHTHLDIEDPVYATDLISWLEKIILKFPKARRISKSTIEKVKRIRSLGVETMLDITRDPRHPAINLGVIPFLEITGSSEKDIPDIPPAYMVSPHAPYSTSEELLKAVARKFTDRLLSIHVAESEEEVKFVRGEPNLFEERIYPVVGRTRGVGTYRSPVDYLERVGLLSQNALLVHCCFIDKRDVETISKHRCTVCVCPRSNLYLSGRIAPVKDLLKAGVNLVLGTDSLASSPDLNLWHEAQLMVELGTDPLTVLAMITTNPLRYLKRPVRKLLLFDIEASGKDLQEIAFEIIYSSSRTLKTAISPFSPPQC